VAGGLTILFRFWLKVDSVNQRAYHEGLPKKRMGAGALFLNQGGQLLLVNPTYKPQWEIPGGVVEQHESPRQACRREVLEELGLACPLERLLSISYIPTSTERLEGLMFLFWGGWLTEAEIDAIRLPATELSEFGFWEIEEALSRLTPTLAERVRRSLDVLHSEQTLYLDPT
jgi:8-oxo-dGTP diphosphatase